MARRNSVGFRKYISPVAGVNFERESGTVFKENLHLECAQPWDKGESRQESQRRYSFNASFQPTDACPVTVEKTAVSSTEFTGLFAGRGKSLVGMGIILV